MWSKLTFYKDLDLMESFSREPNAKQSLNTSSRGLNLAPMYILTSCLTYFETL